MNQQVDIKLSTWLDTTMDEDEIVTHVSRAVSGSREFRHGSYDVGYPGAVGPLILPIGPARVSRSSGFE